MNWDLSFLFSIRGFIAGVVGIFVVLKTLKDPFFGLLFFLFLITVQPHQMEQFPGIETIPIVKIYSIFIFLSIFLNHQRLKRQDRWFFSTHTLIFLIFSLILATSGGFSSSAFEYFTQKFIQVIIIYILITYLVRNPEQVKKFFNVYIFCIGFIVLYCLLGYYGYLGIDTLIERDRELDIDRLRYVGSMSGPNDFALFLVSSLPFAITFMLNTRSNKMKFIYGLIFVLTLYAIRLTYSRGGFLALFAVTILYGLTSKRRWLITGISVTVIGIFLLTSNADYRARIITINKAAEGEEIDDSSMHRLILWRTGINMFNAHPFTGVGMGQFEPNVFNYLPYDATLRRAQIAHNSFVTVLAEAGLPGFVFYLLIIFVAMKTLLRSYKITEKNKHMIDAATFSRPLLISITGILVCGFFLTQSYNWMFYIFLALTHCIKKITVRSQST